MSEGHRGLVSAESRVVLSIFILYLVPNNYSKICVDFDISNIQHMFDNQLSNR